MAVAILAQAGENLRLIANYGTGVDHIDLATARQRNILVTNTPDVLTEATADLTWALLLGLARELKDQGLSGDEIYHTVRRTIYSAVLTHENIIVQNEILRRGVGLTGEARILVNLPEDADSSIMNRLRGADSDATGSDVEARDSGSAEPDNN